MFKSDSIKPYCIFPVSCALITSPDLACVAQLKYLLDHGLLGCIVMALATDPGILRTQWSPLSVHHHPNDFVITREELAVNQDQKSVGVLHVRKCTQNCSEAELCRNLMWNAVRGLLQTGPVTERTKQFH